MCPRPGTILNITATRSLALPSAVSVAPRTQSQRSQRSASFGRRCPQYGHGILSPVVGSGAAAGASVYSTFIFTESPKPHRIRQAQRAGRGPADSVATYRAVQCLETACPQADSVPDPTAVLSLSDVLFSNTELPTAVLRLPSVF